jgi:aryl-alcohol dehydrogenase-like predicted oxidoreductase
LSFPEVSAVIPGMRKMKNLEANIAVSDGRKLSADLMQELKNHVWERNFYRGNDPTMQATDFLEE